MECSFVYYAVTAQNHFLVNMSHRGTMHNPWQKNYSYSSTWEIVTITIHYIQSVFELLNVWFTILPKMNNFLGPEKIFYLVHDLQNYFS